LASTPGDVIAALGDPNVRTGAARVELIERHNIRVPSASGMAMWAPGEFVVVDDDKGIYLADLDGGRERISKSNKDMLDLEGLCLAPGGEQALVVNERTGVVFRFDVEDNDGVLDLADPVALGRLPDISRRDNKGWEGIEIISADLSPTGEPLLVAVHEGSPRRVSIFSYPEIEKLTHFRLPREMKDHMEDISDVTVDPQTGHLFLLSDASETLVEVELTRVQTAAPGGLLENLEMNLLGVTELDDLKRGEKPEGLCFDHEGHLWLATDGDSFLRQYELHRDS
jgi:uncharacterized protein YjiK